MGVLELIDRVLGGPAPAWASGMDLSAPLPQPARLSAPPRTWRVPSVGEALSVPAVHRAVDLIAGTAGMLTVAAYRGGRRMAEPPPVVARPDPHGTPQRFYSATAASKAKWGEFVWWIASRDADGNASALVVVPPMELQVDEDPADRDRPRYRWGSVTGRRWTPARPDGSFVHVVDALSEPYALRGSGPLQRCGVAASISVEAQAWAAQFFAEGGNPSTVIKKLGDLSPSVGADGLTEADRLREQWVSRPHNVPRVIDSNIESVSYTAPDQAGAQMLAARLHQRGDVADMFGIPGSLIEYQQPGSSLTYQNLEGEFSKFVRVCLQPGYLEPIEQALSDLLTRRTVARFNVAGFLRADVKTRYEVHSMAISSGVYDAAHARVEEGLEPGDPEFAPVPPAPPSAVGRPVARAASRDVRCPACAKYLARALGPGSEVECPRCRAVLEVGA